MTPRPIEVRDATERDVTRLAAIYRAASLSNEGDRNVLLAHPDALIFDDAGVRAGRTVVAAVDGRVVGFATVRRETRIVELEDLFVDPDAMRAGVGRALVQRVEGAARRAGARAVEVTANPHALAFYAAVGFRVTGVTQTRFGTAPRMRLDL